MSKYPQKHTLNRLNLDFGYFIKIVLKFDNQALFTIYLEKDHGDICKSIVDIYKLHDYKDELMTLEKWAKRVSKT